MLHESYATAALNFGCEMYGRQGLSLLGVDGAKSWRSLGNFGVVKFHGLGSTVWCNTQWTGEFASRGHTDPTLRIYVGKSKVSEYRVWILSFRFTSGSRDTRRKRCWHKKLGQRKPERKCTQLDQACGFRDTSGICCFTAANGPCLFALSKELPYDPTSD